jgi:SAM-dependent methyltransferase
MEPQTYQLMRRIEDEHWWFAARREIIARLLSGLGLPTHCNILEVGCGTGGNIAFLKRFGNVTGVESDPVAADLARKRELAPVLDGRLPNGLPEFEDCFDLILLLDVIEHVEEDIESLETLSDLLKPGGQIVLTVPAYAFLWSQHDEENQHKRRYNHRNLEKVINDAGLSVDYISYFNFWLFPMVAAIRIFRNLFPYKESWQDMKQPAGVVNRTLRAVFASERFIVGKLFVPFGLSLVSVASCKQPHSTQDNQQ